MIPPDTAQCLLRLVWGVVSPGHECPKVIEVKLSYTDNSILFKAETKEDFPMIEIHKLGISFEGYAARRKKGNFDTAVF